MMQHQSARQRQRSNFTPFPRSFVCRRPWCILLLLLPTTAPLAAADRLEGEIGAIIQAPEYKQAHWGILIAELAGGQTVYELNADGLFAPASVTKLFST